MNKSKRLHIAAGIAVAVLVLGCAALGLLWVSAQGANSAWEKGASDGYHLPGTYSSDLKADGTALSTDGDLLSFAPTEKGDSFTWNRRVHNGVASQGVVKKTDDPNIFYLVDEKGESQGLVHLA